DRPAVVVGQIRQKVVLRRGGIGEREATPDVVGALDVGVRDGRRRIELLKELVEIADRRGIRRVRGRLIVLYSRAAPRGEGTRGEEPEDKAIRAHDACLRRTS